MLLKKAKKFWTRNRKDKAPCEEFDARELFDQI